MQRTAFEWIGRGMRPVLVPTMGALHAGHLALAAKGKTLGAPLVMSIFVNPIQFNQPEDLKRYPRTFDADCAAAEKAGVEFIFAPTKEQMYPEGFQTYVEVEGVSRVLEGEYRPGHFRGVSTVVLKLFQIVQPRVAVFGWKDAQQFILLSRMVRDLSLPVEMVGLETVRETDGLAMSSRNKLLSTAERAAAPALYRGLSALREAAQRGERRRESLLSTVRNEIAREPMLKVQYLEMVSIDELRPLAEFVPGNTLVALAAYLGSTRLIDNIRL